MLRYRNIKTYYLLRLEDKQYNDPLMIQTKVAIV
jgi:hypothetical protein